jgi:hypothetical protein
MFKNLPTRVWLAAVLSAVAAMTAANPVSGASAPLSRARIVAHFDLASGQLPENVVLAPGGRLDVTFAAARQVAEVTPGAAPRILATLPKPADGGVKTPVLGFALTTGIVRDHGGTLYVLYATGTADLTGLWRIRPGGKPERIAALPATGLPNGLALDSRTRTLYVADSVLGRIWRVGLAGGTPTIWSSAPQLAAAGFLGVNGLKIHHGELWATNLDKGTVLRIALNGVASARTVKTAARGLVGIDDFTFVGASGRILAALNGPSKVVLIQADGRHSTVLRAADGLQNPTSVTVRGSTVYVLSAAYITQKDPNLLVAHLGH